MTGPLERVLAAFLTDPAEPRYGYDLMRAAKLPSGTLYPMLARLQDDGLVESRWEPAGQAGRPPRRYYQLTADGIRVARLELAEAAQAASASRQPGRRPRTAPGPAAGFTPGTGITRAWAASGPVR